MVDPGRAPRVTVAAVVERDGRFLLVEEHTPEGLRLNNPAGHLEQGEALIDAVRREVLEETACPFEPEAVLAIYLARMRRPATGEDVTYLRVAFTGRVGPPVPGRALDDGIVRVLWLTPQEIRASRDRHRSPLVLQCLEDHLRGRRHPLDLLHADPSLYDPELKGPPA
jgi:ADP-ribose pyrophosphatase YjhB (NUDIX family)